jgi:hypothetical protein
MKILYLGKNTYSGKNISVPLTSHPFPAQNNLETNDATKQSYDNSRRKCYMLSS